MITNLIIACCEKATKNYAVTSALALFGEKHVCICNNVSGLFKAGETTADAAIIFDKYFMGFVMNDILRCLKILNKTLKFYFVETGECSPFLAVRTHKLGASGFIPGIECSDNRKKGFLEIREGLNSYPDDIVRYIEHREYIDPKCITDVTRSEKEIGICLNMGKTQKEICSAVHLSRQNVSLFTHRLKRKVGYREPFDMWLLTRQSLNDKGDNLDY